MAQITPEQENKIRGLSRHDEDVIQTLAAMDLANIEASGLPPRHHVLCRLAALIAIDGPIASYAWHVEMAFANDLTVDDIVGVLIALAPTVGMARVVAAANKLAIVLDIEMEAGQQAA